MDESTIISLLPKFDTTFFERYAKITLVDLLGEKFLNLVNRDRPDLQDVDAGIGIEVTRALEENRDDAISLIYDMTGNDDSISENDLERVGCFGYSYGIQRSVVGRREKDFWSLAFPLRRIIESKITKVSNGFYGNFAEFDLYIFSRYDLSLQEATDAMDYAIEIQKGLKPNYSFMFIFDTHSLFVCDLYHDIITQIPVTQEQCEMYYSEALNE